MNTTIVEVNELDIPGVFAIRLTPFTDERGFFMRTYDRALMKEAGLHRDWVQENQSRNERKGIVRGLHFQFPPSAETKLVRCVSGEIFDVFVDLRLGQPTFGKWGGLVLSAANRHMVFIPPGFAHGYCTLSEVSDVLYKVDSVYDRTKEGGLRWWDSDIGIEWPLTGTPLLSEKDRVAMSLREFVAEHGGLVVHPADRPA